MIYEIRFKDGVESDLREFDNRVRKLIAKQLQKIAVSPELGELLGNKAGFDLSGCRKMYVDNKRVRIVYRIIEDKIIVEVIAIGDKDEMSVYEDAAQRIKGNI